MHTSGASRGSLLDEQKSLYRVAVDDPSVLSENLKTLCGYLGTPQHTKANQLLGTLVANHASRMLTTVWTVLFHYLRNTSDAKVKLCIISHFGNVCKRINVSQRPNAFRIFSEEMIELLSDIQIVIDRLFTKSFQQVVVALGAYGERGLCREMFDLICWNLKTWDRKDGLRSAASLATCLVAATSECGTMTTFLEYGRTYFSFFAYSLVLDSSVPFVVEDAKRLTCDAAHCSQIIDLKGLETAALLQLLFSGELQNDAIPAVMACFTKLKQFDADWFFSEEDSVCFQILDILETRRKNKMILSPLLAFLAETHTNWWPQASPVWSLTTGDDPFIRLEALSALASAAKRADVDDVLQCLSQVLDIFRAFVQVECSYTVCGALKLMSATFSQLPSSTLEHSGETLREVMCTLSKKNLKLNWNPQVQMMVLDLSHKIPIILPGAMEYVTERLFSSESKVRDCARRVLCHWCRHTSLDSISLIQPFFDGISFLEASACAQILPKHFPQPMLSVLQNYNIVLRLMMSKLTGDTGMAEKERSTTLESACETVICISEAYSRHFDFGSEGPLNYLFFTLYTTMSQLLLSFERFPMGVYIQLIQACRACLPHFSETAFFDLFSHMRLYKLVWNLVYRCCEAIDPIAIPTLRAAETCYLTQVDLKFSLLDLIQRTSESALSNNESFDDTEFFAFADCCLKFLMELTLSGRHSLIFVDNLRSFCHVFLGCLDIFAQFNAVTALQTVAVLYQILFTQRTAHFGEVISLPQNNFLECLNFTAAATAIFSRCLQFDLEFVSGPLFHVFKLLVKCDVSFDSTACYTSVDADYALVRKLISNLTNPRIYSRMRGVEVAESILKLLCSLYQSPHHQEVKNAIGDSAIVAAGDALQAAAAAHIKSDGLILCKELMTALQLHHGAVQGVETHKNDFLHIIFKQSWSTPEEFFENFERLCIAYEAEDEAVEHQLRQLSSESSAEVLVCAAALQEHFIPDAVRAVLTRQCESTLVELLIAVETETPTYLTPLELWIDHRVVFMHDDLLIQVIHNYSGEWIFVTGTYAMLSELTQDNARVGLAEFVANLARNAESAASLPGMSSVDPCVPRGKSESEAVSAALNILPYGVCSVAKLPEHLIDMNALDPATVQEIFENSSGRAAARFLAALAENQLLDLVSGECTVCFARAMLKDPDTPLSLSTTSAEAVLHRLLYLLENSSEEREMRLSLRYSCMFVVVCLSPCFPHSWEDLLDKKGPATLDKRRHIFMRIINSCLETRLSEGSEVGFHLVSLMLHTPVPLSVMTESIVWLIIRCCLRCVWRTLVDGDAALLTEPETIQFLCKVSQTIGFPADIMQEVHARITPLLMSLGTVTVLSGSARRFALWLISSLTLHSTNQDGCSGNPKGHMALIDGVNAYEDFTLDCMSSDGLHVVRERVNQCFFPRFVRQRSTPSMRHWNLHSCGRLLPIWRRFAVPNEVAGSMVLSLLNIYTRTVENVFNSPHTLPFDCVFDVFFSLGTICAGNASVLLRSQAMEGTLPKKLLSCVQGWLQQFATPLLAKEEHRHQILCDHVGLFPESCRSLALHDVLNISMASLVTCTLSRTADSNDSRVPDAVDTAALLNNMMHANLFLHMGALNAIIVMSESVSYAQIHRVMPVVERHFPNALQVSQWGVLSFSFGIQQILRCLCCTIAFNPSGQDYSNICKSIWQCVVSRTCGRSLQRYGHYVVQSIASLTTVESASWEALRKLVMNESSPRYVMESTRRRVDSLREPIPHVAAAEMTLWSDGYRLTVHQRNQLPPHACPTRRVPLSHAFTGSACTFTKEVRQLNAEVKQLLLLETQAALILRSISASANATTLDRSRVEAIDLFQSAGKVHGSYASVVLLTVEVLNTNALHTEDSFFLIVNNFNFSPSYRRLMLHELLLLVGHRRSAERTPHDSFVKAGDEEARWLSVFFETAMQRATCEEDCWWVACAVLTALTGSQNTLVAQALGAALIMPLPKGTGCALAVALARFVARSAAEKDLNAFFTVLRGLADGAPGRAWSVPMLDRLLSVIDHRTSAS